MAQWGVKWIFRDQVMTEALGPFSYLFRRRVTENIPLILWRGDGKGPLVLYFRGGEKTAFLLYFQMLETKELEFKTNGFEKITSNFKP